MSIHAATAMTVYCCVMAAVLGAVLASFLTCAAGRIVAGQSFLGGRSHCDACGHTLGVPDLVPIFSYLFLGGKCRYCGAKVPIRCLLTEVGFAALSVACLWRFDLSVECLRNWLFLCCLLLLSLVDWDSFTIPDGCLIAAAAIWLAALPFLGWSWADIGRHIGAGAVFGGGTLAVSLVMDKILNKDTLGGGDIKLFAVVGLYLSFVGTLLCMILACVLGLALVAARRAGRGQPVPFGPAIALSCALVLLWGQGIINWYLQLLGAA